MAFWKAIGLGIGLLVIRVMMPEVFHGIESTLVDLFGAMRDMLSLSSEAIHHSQTAGGVLYYPMIPGNN